VIPHVGFPRKSGRPYYNTKDVGGMACLTKLLHKRENNTLGHLQQDSGGFTQSPADTIDYLINTHFPGNIPFDSTPTADLPPISIQPIPFITDE
jgi:hypothetical protein